MTSQLNPQAAFATCLCSHTQRRHINHEGFCEALMCGCGEFRAADGPQRLDEPAIPPPPLPLGQTMGAPASPLTVTDPPPAPPPVGRSVLRDGLASPRPGTRKLAEKITALLSELKGRLENETAEAQAREQARLVREQARAEVIELEMKLAAARARLTGKPKTDQPPTSRPMRGVADDLILGSFRCGHDGCDDIKPTERGRNTHEHRKHGTRVSYPDTRP
jgi:hypothetical protein